MVTKSIEAPVNTSFFRSPTKGDRCGVDVIGP